MNKSFHSPPLYDQIQTTAYCLMYNVNDADIVEVVRKAKPHNAHKKLKTEDLRSENQFCSGHAAPETVAADLASTKAGSTLNCDHLTPEIDVIDLASAKAESQSSAPESDRDGLTSTKNVTGTNNVPANVGNTKNRKERSIGGGSADKKTIIEQSKGEYHTCNNSEPQTNDVSATADVALTPNEQQTDSNKLSTSAATIEINVKRVSLDDPIMQHRRNWKDVVLPRLRSFVEAVYRVRADDDKRYRLLSGMSDPSGNSEAWNVLHEECPWLKDCDTAFLRE
jgi:hypothetical protein